MTKLHFAALSERKKIAYRKACSKGGKKGKREDKARAGRKGYRAMVASLLEQQAAASQAAKELADH